ncbi:hypothetical protein FNJ84_19125 [Paracoccus sp. M683]|uniref:hypothetical protein n=1 Tax=Paracoccus sp. M683 TaxID=2594268 RepID=UPI00117C1C57|nr:hypothetical protein [Paracoccus sp. M683]TRW94614.1 hypothetical protein FNJ84_19125 [Paracoccus sp. M683]
MHSRFSKTAKGGNRTRRKLGVQPVLEWAFRTEKARLELPEPPDPDPERGARPGYGLEYVLMQRATLGCRIDGGRYKPDSSTHEDAEVIAACIAGLPTSLGGLRLAIRIAELARAGMAPDWMPGAVPRCVPVEMRRNQHCARSITIPVGTTRVLTRGKWRTVQLRACPITWSPHPDQIAAARRHYAHGWLALEWVRDGLLAGGMLREIRVIDEMPTLTPWSGATFLG